MLASTSAHSSDSDRRAPYPIIRRIRHKVLASGGQPAPYRVEDCSLPQSVVEYEYDVALRPIWHHRSLRCSHRWRRRMVWKIDGKSLASDSRWWVAGCVCLWAPETTSTWTSLSEKGERWSDLTDDQKVRRRAPGFGQSRSSVQPRGPDQTTGHAYVHSSCSR